MASAALDVALAALDPARVEAHLRFLSHPLLEGRGAGTRGGRLAEEYIRAGFAAAGLRSPMDAEDFRQRVPMTGMDPRPTLSVSLPDDTEFAPAYRDDYVLEAGIPRRSVEVEADLVFVGYGITAPEYGWDDYEGVDVRGKVVLVRVNDPGTAERPDFFDGSALTYYGRWTYKFEEAARRGAAGALLIHTEESAGYGWNVVRTSNTGEQYQLAEEPRFGLLARGWITEETAHRLLGPDSAALVTSAARPDFSARPTGVRVRCRVESEIREVATANVAGLRPGTDVARADQPIVLMAHHDHLGVQMDGDGAVTVYPGAYDNASGVALLLALAEAVARADLALERPLLFLATTAEESGLLGADWYTRHPLLPLATTAAILNVDGANLMGSAIDIAPLGVERSTLGDIVRVAAGAEGLELSPEQHPEKGMFFRQDHFPFARAGVPGIAFDHGLRFRDRPDGWGEAWYREFVANHYHQPSDAFRDGFDYRGALQQGRVMLRVAAAVAEHPELPGWLPGAGFERPAPG